MRFATLLVWVSLLAAPSTLGSPVVLVTDPPKGDVVVKRLPESSLAGDVVVKRLPEPSLISDVVVKRAPEASIVPDVVLKREP
ncbi:hypothetical protein PsYK624_119210 [Phanerochaete sordida]|uniref:Uncharacterized protein n=1 Tax=Phanerochaete sordida TaxID=48140 RepID=A0A9P3GIJ1_9APHY|nr:hypothetical protein PsYK624_119210 [Phanerochaete sordida]